MNKLLYFIFCLIILSCNKRSYYESNYVGFLKANDSIQIPFNFSIQDSLMTISNSKEVVELFISQSDNDSLIVESPFFEDIIMYFNHKDSLKGYYYNNSLDRKIPFYAKVGVKRFEYDDSFENFNGNWRIIFNYKEENAFDSEMIVNQSMQNVDGTIRTETGDYGFMQGVVSSNRIRMSNFNGYRGYMIDGVLNNDTIKGIIYRGNYDSEKFIGFKQSGFSLSDPYGLTKMKKGYEKFTYSFNNTEGSLITSGDSKFLGKVNLVQIMGSWCPNCLDETRYLSSLSKKFDEIMITSIAFEFAKSEEKALVNLKKLKNRLDIDYDILLAQFGTSSKIDAAKKLPSLDTLMSYPTLIVIDKYQKVRRIHTGFNGPATGEKYEYFTIEFEKYIEELIKE